VKSEEQGFDPTPYETALSALEIVIGSGPAEVSIRGSAVRLCGSRDSHEGLASFFEAAAGSDHVHFEWFPGNEFVAETSVPLVIALEPDPRI
jgi:hypothetical protein